MDLGRALGINKELNESLMQGGAEGLARFKTALGEMVDVSAKSVDVKTPARAFMDSHWDSLIKPWYEGISDREGVRKMRQGMTMTAAQAARTEDLGISEHMMPWVQAASTDTAAAAEETVSTAGRAARGTAKAVSETLGGWNMVMAAASEAGGAMRRNKVGMVLGAGVAIAAAAGMATGTMEKRGDQAPALSRSSGNAFRPEDRAGVSDQAPGGAWEGSGAARPRRNLIPSTNQMKTAMVAPIHETADLDVRMRAKDRSRAHETARMLSQMATRGDSNITVNYSGQNRRSLRSREKLRSAMDEG
jgi:hypothetical protein